MVRTVTFQFVSMPGLVTAMSRMRLGSIRRLQTTASVALLALMKVASDLTHSLVLFQVFVTDIIVVGNPSRGYVGESVRTL
jgi:hypothetical protein